MSIKQDTPVWFGQVNEWILGGRWNIGGMAQERVIGREGESKFHCSHGAAQRLINKEYRAYLKEQSLGR